MEIMFWSAGVTPLECTLREALSKKVPNTVHALGANFCQALFLCINVKANDIIKVNCSVIIIYRLHGEIMEQILGS